MVAPPPASAPFAFSEAAFSDPLFERVSPISGVADESAPERRIRIGRSVMVLSSKVADNGSGVAPDEQAKIFEPFYRGNQGKRFKQGMGLGLSIASDLVKAHGGSISLDSTPGKGSQFTIHLPLERPDSNLGSAH